MSRYPVIYPTRLSQDLICVRSRARLRRGRMVDVAVGACALMVLFGLLAIPLFLLFGLDPMRPLHSVSWQHFHALLSGTLRAASCAILVALPLGLATAVFTAHFAAARLRAWIKPALELLEAVPSVVLGLIAVATLAPWLAQHLSLLLTLIVAVPVGLLVISLMIGSRTRHPGWLPISVLPAIAAIVAIVCWLDRHGALPTIVPGSPWNASLVGLALGVASIPLVFSVAEDALFLVPRTHTEAAFALGATRWQAFTSVLLPAAGSGLIAAGILGFSRCLGETMIVLMASGNTPIGGIDPLIGLRTISAELALGMPEAVPASDPYRVLLLCAFALLMLTLCVSSCADLVRDRLRRRLQAGTP